MNRLARGDFDVRITPQPHVEGTGDAVIARMALDKRFRGELDASSLGQMLAFRSAVPGSAAYVAMERVVGKLAGREGSFVLQHHGTMDRGAAALLLTVVPDSGSDALLGLTGSMKIIIADGQHSYEFEYSLPDDIR